MAIKPVSELVEAANRQVEVLQPSAALARQVAGAAILVDIRDIRELDREGRIEGAVHAPRGMLEFWFDPACKYHREVFADSQKTYVLFCAAGWRSALGARCQGAGRHGFRQHRPCRWRIRGPQGGRRPDSRRPEAAVRFLPACGYSTLKFETAGAPL